MIKLDTHKSGYDCIIIGGGAAGMLAAGYCGMQLSPLGKRVAIIEKNSVFGRKLRITGKGRCNLTNNCQPDEVISNMTKNPRFMYGAVNSFTPADTMELFESLGVALKTERGNRVFPVSDKANDIADSLVKFMKDNSVDIINEQVLDIKINEGKISAVKTQAGVYPAKSVLIACGGSSYPGTGSNGDGIRLAKKLGHKVTDIIPSLVPLVENGEKCARMQGLSLRNCGFKILDNKRKKVVFEDFGEMLFTHFGLSGPAALSASAHMREMENGRYTAEIDLKPALDEKKLDARILRDFDKNKNRIFANSLDELLPKKIIPVIIEESGINPQKRCNEITKQERRRLLEIIKGFKVEIGGFRPIKEAIVTSGGVDVKEIDPKTMGSEKVEGLYFAGEVIDVDAYTGGFNLQIAFSTAHCAARAICR